MNTVRIGVISDTHVNSIDDIPNIIKSYLSDMDIIIHAGDFTEKLVLDGLKTLGEVKAVCGNSDSRELKQLLPPHEIFEINWRKIAVIHGSGAPFGLMRRVYNAFPEVDVIIFGHSHVPLKQVLKGVLMFNPGEARASFGVLTINDHITADIHLIEE